MTEEIIIHVLSGLKTSVGLLINNRIDWRDHNSCSFWAENFGRSLEGQGGPTRGSKVFNTIIQMEAGHLRENPQIPQQQETLQAITYKAAKRLMRLLLAANNQATRRNEIIKSYLQLGSSSNRYAPRLPQQETKSSTKQLPPTGPILGPENILKTGFAQKGLPSKRAFNTSP